MRLIDYREKRSVQGQNTKNTGRKERFVIDPAFEKLARSIGMGLIAQRNYLVEYHHLHTQTRKISYGYEQTKALLLTSPEIRDNEELQHETAEVIKEMNREQARETVSKVKVM